MITKILALVLLLSAWAGAQAQQSPTAYNLVNLALLGSEAADITTHFQHVNRQPDVAVEKWSPWLYGTRPSPARMTLTMLGTHGLLLSVMKERGWDKKKKVWIPIFIGVTLGHTIAAIHNSQF